MALIEIRQRIIRLILFDRNKSRLIRAFVKISLSIILFVATTNGEYILRWDHRCNRDSTSIKSIRCMTWRWQERKEIKHFERFVRANWKIRRCGSERFSFFVHIVSSFISFYQKKKKKELNKLSRLEGFDNKYNRINFLRTLTNGNVNVEL